MNEVKPRIILAFLVAKSAFVIAVKSARIEIAAVFADVIEHAVQNHVNPVCMQLLQKFCKIIFCSEHRIDFHVIVGIVAMVAGCLKNGIQVDHRDAKLL